MSGRFLVGLVLLVAAGQACALNKCTATDGRVSYQDAPCSAGAASAQIAVPMGPKEAAEQWKFAKEKDAMTGVVTCFAYSPSVSTNWGRGGYSYSLVYLQLAVSRDAASMVLSVRASEYKDGIFHNDISGQGIKPDNGDFFPLIEKYGQRGLGIGLGKAGPLIGALQKSKSFSMRLRFWPYEKLHDTPPVSLAGFDKAIRSAMDCGAN